MFISVPSCGSTVMSQKRLRFYAGQLYNPWTSEYVAGLHVPMLTPEEVMDIRNILEGKKKKKWVQTRVHSLFPLRGGTVLCEACNQPLTGSSSKGQTKLHHYYHCYTRQCDLYSKSIRKDDVEKAFIEKLDKISPTEKFIAVFKKAVLSEWEARLGQHNRAYEAYANKLKGLEHKKARLYDLREDGSYTAEEFKERKEKLEIEIATLSISRNETNIDRMEIEMLLAKATGFLMSLGAHWKKQPVHIQKRFQQLVFPEGIVYSRISGFGTAKLGLIFELNRRFAAQKSTRVVLF
jgi:site-specific DNA recombinase